MSGQMLLINPAKSRRKSPKRKRNPGRSAAQRRATAKMLAANRARRSPTRRASNPITHRRRTMKRRRNPVSYIRRAVTRSRRRRNPISMGGSLFNFRSYMAPLKDAAIMGAGAVAVDVAFGYINRYLPASVQKVPGSVGVGDAVKAVLTVALGRLLAKPTRGLSNKAAMGSLVVQMRDIAMTLMPASMAPAVNGLGFMTPGYTVPQVRRASNYTGPGMQRGGVVGQISTNGRSPLLAAIHQGSSPLLSGPALRFNSQGVNVRR